MNPHESDKLGQEECWSVLRSLDAGWLIYNRRMLPTLDPISEYRVTGDVIVFHAAAELKVHRFAVGSLHVQLTSLGGGSTTSVIAHGRIREVSVPASDPQGEAIDLSAPIMPIGTDDELALDVRILEGVRFAPPLRCQHRHLALAGSRGHETSGA